MSRPKGSTTYDYERIVKLWRRGFSSDYIARRLGCSQRTVNRAVRKQVNNAADDA